MSWNSLLEKARMFEEAFELEAEEEEEEGTNKYEDNVSDFPKKRKEKNQQEIKVNKPVSKEKKDKQRPIDISIKMKKIKKPDVLVISDSEEEEEEEEEEEYTRKGKKEKEKATTLPSKKLSTEAGKNIKSKSRISSKRPARQAAKDARLRIQVSQKEENGQNGITKSVQKQKEKEGDDEKEEEEEEEEGDQHEDEYENIKEYNDTDSPRTKNKISNKSTSKRFKKVLKDGTIIVDYSVSKTGEFYCDKKEGCHVQTVETRDPVEVRCSKNPIHIILLTRMSPEEKKFVDSLKNNDRKINNLCTKAIDPQYFRNTVSLENNGKNKEHIKNYIFIKGDISKNITCGILFVDLDTRLNICHVSILCSKTGSRSGNQLISYAEVFAAKNKMKQVQLEALPPVTSFYLRMGYKYKPGANLDYDNEVWRDGLGMYKDL